MRFLLRPAGSGKTFHCLEEIRSALTAAPSGPPLLLVAPRQTTYQLERQLLAEPALPGYTRLQILSFERLARWILERLGRKEPAMLDEEGRVMVLRSLLAIRRPDLKVFRASARLNGFAQQLSPVLRDLQRDQQTSESLNLLAGRFRDNPGLTSKLQDLAVLLLAYQEWVREHDLQDADQLLSAATAALTEAGSKGGRASGGEDAGGQMAFTFSRPPTLAPAPAALWVDGFAEFSAQELDLLAALVPHCERATVTFCLETAPAGKVSWLSNWWLASRALEECRKRFAALPGVSLVIDGLRERPARNRFTDCPVLRHLEEFWAEPQPYSLATRAGDSNSGANLDSSSGAARVSTPADEPLRLVTCAEPEAEATFAAREILRYVRSGGRFREVTVLVRSLAAYHATLQRVFDRYEIPFFLDRRQPVAHHPLAELTRSALRVLAMGWQHEDWFAALKAGLVPAGDEEIDQLENEALARGWRGNLWRRPIQLREPAKSSEDETRLRQLESRLEQLRQRLVAPFEQLHQDLGLEERRHEPTGVQLAAGLRQFWNNLEVERQLQDWAASANAGREALLPASVHATVWDQMNAWLSNVELAFPDKSLSLRDWLPILESGLGNLSVGVIPPALDQVLIGAVDRSRDPDVKLGFVLGLNETVFPARLATNVLLTEADRAELERQNVNIGGTARQHLARERYYIYLALTRARERLVLTWAQHDAQGSPLNPSPFLDQVRQLFPAVTTEIFPRSLDWRESEHPAELIGPLLRMQNAECRMRNEESADEPGQPPVPDDSAALTRHASRVTPLIILPALGSVLDTLRQFQVPVADSLSPELAARLYGPVLRTSVSRMEQFAACPFKFFVHSGLRAEERQLYELDRREQGSFQHDALALFHDELRRENKRWRDITPAVARERMGRVTETLSEIYRQGLLKASEQSRFLARVLAESLQDFIETIVGWMQGQYLFDPIEVELPFGEDESSPAWSIALPGGQRLDLYGRIDRVDLFRKQSSGEALCVVVDYKSGHKQLEPLLLANGLQLQLLAYLNVLRRWPNPRARFGAERLVPAGVFYVSLRGRYKSAHNRTEALADTEQARKAAYTHTGRFDADDLRYLDARPEAGSGDQFIYRRNRNGQLSKNSREALGRDEFIALLDSIETSLQAMGREIFSGRAEVSPYRKGPSTACDQCEYRPICRIDPWTHHFRVLRRTDDSGVGNPPATD